MRHNIADIKLRNFSLPRDIDNRGRIRDTTSRIIRDTVCRATKRRILPDLMKKRDIPVKFHRSYRCELKIFSIKNLTNFAS